ncbi:hypothetical protein [Thermogemmatispora onikobensis]|uniref:hypothetical protein n=1 Tax=Thermogemmatispora onikobensis TaxID=732234 RepID=UPI000853BFE0|nr:hypothetical protein [Thermogemmatispora onikobensis]
MAAHRRLDLASAPSFLLFYFTYLLQAMSWLAAATQQSATASEQIVEKRGLASLWPIKSSRLITRDQSSDLPLIF